MKIVKMFKTALQQALSMFVVSNSGCSNVSYDPNDRVFILTTTTPYAYDEIIEFMSLTGLTIDKTEKLLADFCRCGIAYLKDVNIIVKMGYFHCC